MTKNNTILMPVLWSEKIQVLFKGWEANKAMRIDNQVQLEKKLVRKSNHKFNLE